MGKIIVGAIIVAGIVAFFAMRGDEAKAPASIPSAQDKQTTGSQSAAMNDPDGAKEFVMTSYYDADGKWFSLKEIRVNKGDTVRIKVTNTKGSHDFTIDEYNIKQATPLNEETIIEFKADKVGDFVYYCSMPGHRAGGQWGTLKVTE